MTADRDALLLELADRCEAATGPDRELDALIWQAVFPREYAERVRAMGALGGTTLPPTPPRFTANLAKSKVVVPLGHDWVLYSDGVAGCKPRQEDGCTTASIHAETAELALCAAALRARATQAPTP